MFPAGTHTLPQWSQGCSTIQTFIQEQLSCSDKSRLHRFQSISFTSGVWKGSYSSQRFLFHTSSKCHCQAEAWRNGWSLPKVCLAGIWRFRLGITAVPGSRLSHTTQFLSCCFPISPLSSYIIYSLDMDYFGFQSSHFACWNAKVPTGLIFMT